MELSERLERLSELTASIRSELRSLKSEGASEDSLVDDAEGSLSNKPNNSSNNSNNNSGNNVANNNTAATTTTSNNSNNNNNNSSSGSASLTSSGTQYNTGGTLYNAVVSPSPGEHSARVCLLVFFHLFIFRKTNWSLNCHAQCWRPHVHHYACYADEKSSQHAGRNVFWPICADD